MSDFLKDLGQNARTEYDLQKEAQDRFERNMLERSENVVQKIKEQASSMAKGGKFTIVNGRRQITGEYDVTFNPNDKFSIMIEWISHVRKRLPWRTRGYYLFGGLCSLGIYPFYAYFWDEDKKDDAAVALGQAKLTSDSQRFLQMVQNTLDREGIKINRYKVKSRKHSYPQADYVIPIFNPTEAFYFKYNTTRGTKIKQGDHFGIDIEISYTVTF